MTRECKQCGQRFEYNKSDIKHTTEYSESGYHDYDHNIVYVECPHCSQRVVLKCKTKIF